MEASSAASRALIAPPLPLTRHQTPSKRVPLSGPPDRLRPTDRPTDDDDNVSVTACATLDQRLAAVGPPEPLPPAQLVTTKNVAERGTIDQRLGTVRRRTARRECDYTGRCRARAPETNSSCSNTKRRVKRSLYGCQSRLERTSTNHVIRAACACPRTGKRLLRSYFAIRVLPTTISILAIDPGPNQLLVRQSAHSSDRINGTEARIRRPPTPPPTVTPTH